MVSIYSVNPNQLIDKAAEELKKINAIEPPVWANIVKTGMSRERPPTQSEWWYVRSAAILRSIYKLGPIGVSKLRTKYGGRKNRGNKPEKFYIASGNIIRKIMQQLEKAELIKKVEIGVHKGKVIAPKGKSLLDKSAIAIIKSMPKEAPIVETKPAEKPAAEQKVETKPAAEKPEAKKSEPKPKKPKKKKPVAEAKPAEAKPAEAPKAEEKPAEVKKE